MARPFRPKSAQKLIETHKKILEDLDAIPDYIPQLREETIKAADELAAQELIKTLQGIPVDEINRGKKGLRVGALRSAGYETIADIAYKPEAVIASVYGIGNSAPGIVRSVAEIVSAAKQTIKIRLSTDEKTPSASRLVVNLARYRDAQEIDKESRELIEQNLDTVVNEIEGLYAGTKGFGWLFTSQGKKDRASEAYTRLTDMLSGVYGQKANELFTRISANKRISSTEAWQDFSENSVRFFNTLEDIYPGILGNSDSIYGLSDDLAKEIQEQSFFPEGLLCELRRYQEWGVKYILHQERVLLGDEMGLGKTVQAIAAMVSLRNTGATHFVVVCPASVITNWCREIQKMSRLDAVRVHGSSVSSAIKSWIKTGGVAITTYETAWAFRIIPEDFRFSMLVVDEAHYIKNPNAQRTRSVVRLSEHAQRLLFMTGTALENKVDEMITLIRMLQPEVADTVQNMAFMSSAPQFRKAVAPVYYRRKREDVLTELPELIESREWCTLGPYEEVVYENAVLGKNYADARRVSWNVEDLTESCKARRMKEIIDDAESEGRKVLVFSFFLDTLQKVRTYLGSRCVDPINGSVPPQRRQEIIDEFDKAPAGTVLTAQIQSGGTGLNIQSASVVILCEPQFKPSMENQAVSRAYRMGQTRNVLLYRLLCENTVDEKIMNLLEEKQAIFDAYADKSEAAEGSYAIDTQSFGNLIQQEIDRINAKRQGKEPPVGKASAAGAESTDSLDSTQAEDPESGYDEDRPYALTASPNKARPVRSERNNTSKPGEGVRMDQTTTSGHTSAYHKPKKQPVFCRECGKRLPVGSVFCPECGTKAIFLS